MDMGEAVIVAGIGCRRNVSLAQVLAAVDAALAKVERSRADLSVLATAEIKRDEAGIVDAARILNLRLVIVAMCAIEAEARNVETRSLAAERRFGVPSIAEAAARSVAGPAAYLILPRLVCGNVTCALAAALP